MTIWQILTKKGYVWYLIPIPILYLAGTLWFPLLIVYGFILAYTMFDLIGYEGLRQVDKEHNVITGINIQVNSYRILQFSYYLAALALSYLLGDWRVVCAALLAHMTGFCDILYHAIGGYNQDFYTWWTPFGYIRYLITGKKTSPLWLNLLQVVVGAVGIYFIYGL